MIDPLDDQDVANIEHAEAQKQSDAASILFGTAKVELFRKTINMNPNIIIYGDTHGDTDAHLDIIQHAKDLGINKMYQAGDCGFFPHFRDTWMGIERVQQALAQANVTDHWVRGNHDDPNEWDHICNVYPRTKTGWGVLRENIYLAPRVHYWKHNGLKFLGVGGAVSIDRAYRLKVEKKAGTLWWPNEIISEQDVLNVGGHKIDVLITHECSNHTPFRGRFKEDSESEDNRRRLDEILRKSKPDTHFHGHMHTRYEWENYLSHGHQHSTQTYGLECNPEAMEYGGIHKKSYDNWGVFNTDTKKFTWGLQVLSHGI